MCTSPRSATYHESGKINFSMKHPNKEFVPFQLPCGKCAECLLERARDWSIRCIHEASTYENNCFITLTYSPENLPLDGQLNHFHFQLFMKRLRKYAKSDEIGFFMCGEYGDQTLRPHYHACIFGFDFDDKKPVRQNKLGDQIWNSEKLTELWGLGHTELGSVTQQSAGYVARYILKKQKNNGLLPYQKMSRKHAIGKRFIEKYWRDVFLNATGSIILSDGSRSKVPRYYEKWLQKYQPETWTRYVTQIKLENTSRLQKKAELEMEVYKKELNDRYLNDKSQHDYKSPLARKREALKQKIKQLKRTFL